MNLSVLQDHTAIPKAMLIFTYMEVKVIALPTSLDTTAIFSGFPIRVLSRAVFQVARIPT